MYRDREEIEEARKRDPLEKLHALLSGTGMLSEERDAAMKKRARDEVNLATETAEAAPFPGDEDVFRHVTSET